MIGFVFSSGIFLGVAIAILLSWYSKPPRFAFTGFLYLGAFCGFVAWMLDV